MLLRDGSPGFLVNAGLAAYMLAAEEIYREALEVILQGLTSEVLDHRGARYTYRKVPMILRPFQRPHPPLWYGLGHAAGAEWAATNRVHVITNNTCEAAAPLFARYREVWERKHGGAPTTKLGSSPARFGMRARSSGAKKPAAICRRRKLEVGVTTS